VTAFAVRKKDIVMHLDTSGGFTDFNTIAPEILKQEESLVGRTWLYEVLYQTELIICCNDIIVEEK